MTKDMILQPKDIEILKDSGYSDNDLIQIQEAINISDYTLNFTEPPYDDIRSLTARDAYNRLGREEFLSGIAMSAFHWSSSRICKNPKFSVLFDSSKLFK